jgi:hypothetical protein
MIPPQEEGGQENSDLMIGSPEDPLEDDNEQPNDGYIT